MRGLTFPIIFSFLSFKMAVVRRGLFNASRLGPTSKRKVHLVDRAVSKKDESSSGPRGMSAKRQTRLDRLLSENRIIQSDFTLAELRKKNRFPDLMLVEEDVIDEAELRARFPRNGFNHKFFNGKFVFKFFLPSDCTGVDNEARIVVAHIYNNARVRMPSDINELTA